MKQALHIFGKDARRLWPQIAVVVALFSIYGFVSPEAALGKSASLLDWNGIPAALVVLACWTLGAGVIHEDGPAEESPFWLTRPYKRTSLVGAKVLFLFAFIFVPLLLTGVVLEIRAGANVFPNAVSLVGLCLLRSLWLILPAVSLGVVTQGLLDFAGALLALWILLLLPEVRGLGTGMILFANDSLLQNASVASILPVTAAGLAAVGLQFARRRTPSSRWLITSGILASAVLLTGDTAEAVSRRIMHPGFDPDQIRITFDRSQTKGRQSQRNRTCSVAPLTVEGLPKNMV
ncbi:MAG TPA: hypothetical protein VFT60_13420, partial [Bryobacteraceae bacterium]|nr:hypothetical protein [Bryobacteraceae bacterium]